MEKSIYTEEYRILLTLLRKVREEAGLTQTQLAEKIGQTQSFVTKYERGERRLDITQVRTICQALGTTLTAFVQLYEQRLARDGQH